MVTKVCHTCGKSSYIDIPKDVYEKWQFGISIQEAWPEGSATERETLISGLCKECQEGVFNDVQGETGIQED